jgi:hypothetical protein
MKLKNTGMFQVIYDMVLFLEPKFSAISLWTSTSFLKKTRLNFPKPKYIIFSLHLKKIKIKGSNNHKDRT